MPKLHLTTAPLRHGSCTLQGPCRVQSATRHGVAWGHVEVGIFYKNPWGFRSGYWKIAIYSGFSHSKWWFSIAMLDYHISLTWIIGFMIQIPIQIHDYHISLTWIKLPSANMTHTLSMVSLEQCSKSWTLIPLNPGVFLLGSLTGLWNNPQYIGSSSTSRGLNTAQMDWAMWDLDGATHFGRSHDLTISGFDWKAGGNYGLYRHM